MANAKNKKNPNTNRGKYQGLSRGLCAVYEATHLNVYIRNNVMRNYGNNYTEIRILYPNGGI